MVGTAKPSSSSSHGGRSLRFLTSDLGPPRPSMGVISTVSTAARGGMGVQARQGRRKLIQQSSGVESYPSSASVPGERT